MEVIFENWDYSILVIVIILSLCSVPFVANKQLNRPLSVYGGLVLSSLLPITIPIYMGVMFFKAKSARLSIYIFLLAICLVFLNITASKYSTKIELSDLYSGDIELNQEGNVSIEGGFLKLHEKQYIFKDTFSLGGQDVVSNHFYYEIVPLNINTTQKVRVFVSDLETYNGKPPTENEIYKNRFDAYFYLMKNIDKTVLEKITKVLKADQKVVFISEHSKSRFKSNQSTAKIGGGIFVFLSLVFIILAFREFKLNQRLTAET